MMPRFHDSLQNLLSALAQEAFDEIASGELARVLLQVGCVFFALGKAHSDIKPNNVMITNGMFVVHLVSRLVFHPVFRLVTRLIFRLVTCLVTRLVFRLVRLVSRLILTYLVLGSFKLIDLGSTTKFGNRAEKLTPRFYLDANVHEADHKLDCNHTCSLCRCKR
jgi:hypothetical protein